MMDQAVIFSAVAPVHKEATFTSEMITQGLMWEYVSILNKNDNWYRVTMEDGYAGWIHYFYLFHKRDTILCTVPRTQGSWVLPVQ